MPLPDSFPDAPPFYRERPPRFEEETNLVSVGLDHHNRVAFLHPDAAAAWYRLCSAGKQTGIHLLLISAFRSYGRQTEIVRRKRAQGLSWDEILRVSAFPGFSEHHTGRAIDLASPECPTLIEAFEDTPEFAWLLQRADEFGFHLSYPRASSTGVVYEPWHWLWKAMD
ncbi:MAG: M15 family metallopeptidase [Opitutaceae bacterium]|nr:M15 family metallopeptidase [Opitutaceae bacterium]